MNAAKMAKIMNDKEAYYKRVFSTCTDLHIHKLKLFGEIPGMLVYFREMVDSKQLDSVLITALLKNKETGWKTASDIIQWMHSEAIPAGRAEVVKDPAEIEQRIALGHIILVTALSDDVICIRMENNQIDRQVEEPESETLVRGPHLGFIENIETNMVLIRKRVHSPNLKMEKMAIGHVSRTDVVLAYIENTTPFAVIQAIRNRLSRIDVDLILESGNIEELIVDVSYTPFPLMQMTERPDVVSAYLLEGRAAILIENSPMALVIPGTFWDGLHAVEDYYINYIIATTTRWLRYFFASIALLLPAFYVAITTFHQEMIPTSLALSIAAAREAVPFPALIETLMMEITFEALREAGIRLPRPIGQTISIVGALVIGQAAVQAGIISAPIIIVVSLTGIASFLIPQVNMNNAIRLCRFPLILLAGMFGLYGLGVGLLALLIHLVNLQTFGVPYLFPVAPFSAEGLWDVFVRAPWSIMHKRRQRRQGKLGTS